MPELKKILVIQTAFLGDVVLATGILEKLHNFYPEAKLYFLVRKGNEGLVRDHPFLDHLYVFNKKEKIKSLLYNIRRIRKEKYDLVINLQRFFTSGIITVLSGGKKTVGFKKNPLSFAFKKSSPHIIAPEEGIHETERNHSLIEDITDSKAAPPVLYPSEKDYEIVSAYKGSPYICIAPASIWFTKQYPKEKWIELIDELKEYKIFLLGAPGDIELCKYIKNNTIHSELDILAGKLDFLQSAALMKDAVMNYVNDSAPMHLASAVNAPVTAVYCSTIPGFGFGPLSENSFVVEKKEPLYCRPCGLHGYRSCPEGHFRCAYDIKKEQLLDVLHKAKDQ